MSGPSQIRRGTLELCVLALISSKPRCGYDLVSALERWEPLATTEGTVYPLLRRLQREGRVEASWQESAAGPPRMYYRLTPHGHDLLGRMIADRPKPLSSSDIISLLGSVGL
ncbi:MAG: PadR family transcriptional regulator [Actinomycetota bacterium]|nr:PadR family transcriptional regulator [Actinomycetota bacterium]